MVHLLGPFTLIGLKHFWNAPSTNDHSGNISAEYETPLELLKILFANEHFGSQKIYIFFIETLFVNLYIKKHENTRKQKNF